MSEQNEIVNNSDTQEVAPLPVFVDINLNLNQINLILNLLSQLPYKDSANLIEYIRNQAMAQLQANQEAAAAAAQESVLQ